MKYYESKYTGAEVDALLGQVESGEVGGKVTVDSALSTESENPVMNRVITAELGKKADTDGVYSDLTAGDLAGRGESVPAEFSFRATGGKSIKDGRAYIKRIKGNSVVWNQLADSWDKTEIKAANFSYYDDYAETNLWYGYDPIRINMNMSARNGHKILMLLAYQNESDSPWMNLEIAGTSMDGFGSSQDICKFYVVNVGESDTNYLTLYPHEDQGYVKLSHLRVYDLTLMFGAGNEPTTIEEFYSLIPSGIDLFAYNEGQVIHCNTESIKSVGDNALNVDRSLVFDFDGSYGNYDFINTEDAFVGISADGYINTASIDYAEKIEGGFRLRPNGGGYGIGLFVKALPNEEYSVSYASDNGRIAFSFYDKGKNLISYEMWENRFTTPSNCEYIMLCLRDNEVVDIDIRFTDIMLTLVHSGWKQDTDAGYQPYWQDTLPLPIIRKYFPQGMKSAGSAHDEIRYNKASGKWEYSKGKIKSVDLGDLTWETPWYNDNDGWRIFAQLQDKLLGLSNILNKRYANAGVADGAMSDKSITGNDNLNYIYIADSSFSAEGVDALIASLQDVMLYYESNDWEWVELDAEDQNFRDYYNVADFGTEMSQSSVPSAAFSADIIYQFNAVDMIREHELEITELQKVIATMQTQLTSLTSNNA